ncbi:hypothetical protein QFC19_004813 [Naganishia cerealis]|uniref:Uncharacterized protein n=1 Tax=Naganishia cerealis TaxID=610337 RepID=A0ACC2VUF2_9TREE|nr:hypothetical protein QFC19_004813 [Naganishia cerealis]
MTHLPPAQLATFYSRPSSPAGQRYDKDSSMILVGQAGVGKSTIGSMASQALHWQLIETGYILPNTPGGLSHEVDLLDERFEAFSDVLRENGKGKVIVCHADMLEHVRIRRLLHEYGTTHGPVIHVTRRPESVAEYLRMTTPEFDEEGFYGEWPYREAEIRDVSTFLFMSLEDTVGGQDTSDRHPSLSSTLHNNLTTAQQSPIHLPYVNKDLIRLLKFIRGTYTNHVPYTSFRSYYLSLTYEHIALAIPHIQELSVGIDCWELRADLLRDMRPESVVYQLALLRRFSDLPVIFALRTRSQGGMMPDLDRNAEAAAYTTDILKLALKMGVEYVDVNNVVPRDTKVMLLGMKGNSKIIASWHDYSGQTSWLSSTTYSFYKESVKLGADVVMMVNTAKDNEDNLDVRKFSQHVQKDVPLVAFNIGAVVSDVMYFSCEGS